MQNCGIALNVKAAFCINLVPRLFPLFEEKRGKSLGTRLLLYFLYNCQVFLGGRTHEHIFPGPFLRIFPGGRHFLKRDLSVR
jgi:hypothetical protein